MLQFSILKNTNYKNLYFAGLFSDIGTFVTETVFLLFIFTITQFNTSYLGLFKTSYALGLGSGMIIGSVIGVRFFKKDILIYCELCRIPFIILLFLYHPAWFVIICFGIIAFFTGVFSPNRQALINYFLKPSDISKANALLSSTYALLYMIGPLVGSVIYSQFNQIHPVLYFDLFTYVFGMMCLFKMNILNNDDYHATFKKNSKFFETLVQGFHYIWGQRLLRRVLVNAVVIGIAMGAVGYLLLPYSIIVFHQNKTNYGTIMAFLSLGGIAGGIFGGYLGNIFHHRKIIAWIPFFETTMMIFIVFFTQNYLIWLLLIFMWGVTIFIRIYAQSHFISKEVPLDYLGRIHAIMNFMFILSGVLGGAVVTIFGDVLTAVQLLRWVAVILFGILMFIRLVQIQGGNLQSC